MTGDRVCIYKEVIINDRNKSLSTILCEDFYNYMHVHNNYVIKIIINACFKAVPGSEPSYL